jgi:hypothetical protein
MLHNRGMSLLGLDDMRHRQCRKAVWGSVLAAISAATAAMAGFSDRPTLFQVIAVMLTCAVVAGLAWQPPSAGLLPKKTAPICL